MNEASSLLHFLKATIGLPYEPVIAGGYARDRILGAKPRDIDVFLLNAEDRHSDVSARLCAQHIPHIVEVKDYRRAEEIPIFSPAINFAFLNWSVQLIATPENDISGVLATFDYNVCRFYISPDNESIPFCPADFDDLVHKRMRLQHTRTPWSSLRRGILMADRFGFEFHPPDRDRLVEALYAEREIADEVERRSFEEAPLDDDIPF